MISKQDPSSTEDAPQRSLPHLSDEELSLLLTFDKTSRHDVFCDVDDIHLYGSKHQRTIVGDAAQRMIDAGLEPKVGQSVEWFCFAFFAFFPIKPLGTRIVASYRDKLPDGEDHGRSVPTAMDSHQAFVHFVIGILSLCVVVAIIVTAFWRSLLYANR